jgi:putative PIN family toxin of toxin-antitoxin system
VRVVVDTNVLVRALMNPDGTWGDVVRRFREYTHVMSPSLLDELLTVVVQPRLKSRFGTLGQRQGVARALEIAKRAEIVEPGETPRIVRDEDDDALFACAVAGSAEYIISQDEDVLAVGEYQGVKTIRAAAFLKLLGPARWDHVAG